MSDNSVKDGLVEIIEEQITDTLRNLWKQMSSELEKYGSGSGNFTPSLLVSKIRDYNRKWNKLAEDNQFMEPDGFKVAAKKLLSKEKGRPLGKEFQDALKYL